MSFYNYFFNKKESPLKIVVAGMPQSGSTMVFNLISELLNYYSISHEFYLFGPKKYRKTVNELFLKNKKTHNAILIKEHHFEPFLKEWSDLLILCKRDIRDSIASRRRRGKLLISKSYIMQGYHKHDPNSFDGFKEWCNYITRDCIEKWEKADYTFDYEKSINNKYKLISDIDKTLRKYKPISEFKKPDYNNFVKKTLIGNKARKFDMNTKVTSNKGQIGNYKDYLLAKELIYIEKNHKKWIFEK